MLHVSVLKDHHEAVKYTICNISKQSRHKFHSIYMGIYLRFKSCILLPEDGH